MNCSKYKSTRETTNRARVSRLIFGPCTEVLCRVLQKEITHPTLLQNVKAFIAKYPKHKKPPINKDQEKLVYAGDYSTFDITLLYTLLRNICNIPPHAKQWGSSPIAGDRSLSANIERIRVVRNNYGHNPNISTSDQEFRDTWQNEFEIVKDLEKYLGSSTDIQDAVKIIKTCTMDPEQEIKYINQLYELNREILHIEEKIQNMKNECVPQNVKEQHNKDVSQWREDDSVFFETHNFRAMLEQVREQPYTTFVGVPGSGKTVTVRHIALKLQDEGYTILNIREIRDIETYCDPHNPQVFVIDDMLGVFGFNMTEFNVLNRFKDKFINPTMSKTKVLMTCREVVFRSRALPSTHFILNAKNVVQLHSKNNALTIGDKHELLAKYQLDRDMLTDQKLLLTSNMFPYLCKLFSKEKNFRAYGPEFFISPIPCILHILDEMQTGNKLQYASLILLMGFQNNFSEDDLDSEKSGDDSNNKDELKQKVLKSCNVSLNTECFQLINAMKEMEGTFTRQCCNQFTFVHDSIMEIVAYHFAQHSPELILKYMSCDYIAHYIKVDPYSTHESKEERKTDKGKGKRYISVEEVDIIDLCTTLKSKSRCNLFAERLYTDIEKGEFYNVFMNKALKQPLVLQAIICVIESKPFSELHCVFLSEIEETSKIVQGYYQIKYNFSHQMSDIFCRTNNMYTARAISWIVYFGHHQILQCIIHRIINETGVIQDLFQPSYSKCNKHPSSTEAKDADDTFARSGSYFLPDQIDNPTGSINALSSASSDTNNESVTESESLLEEQRRLLCLGCCSGDVNVVQLLLKHINIDAMNKILKNQQIVHWKNEPLIIACEFGYSDIALELLKARADVNCKVGMHTPLTVACENGYLDIVTELVKAGSIVNADDGYQTPLIAACYKKLIEAGADVNLECGSRTPLITACHKGHLNVVEVLITSGTNINQINNQNTPLTVACETGNCTVVDMLIKGGADVNLNNGNKTPLTTASKKGYQSVVVQLIKAEANVNLGDGTNSPLNTACQYGHSNIVEELIKSKADINLRYDGSTPLTTACSYGHTGIVEDLIKAGVDVNLRGNRETPLTAACIKGNADVIKILIKAGIDVNPENEEETPLAAALYRGHTNVTEELIKAGADVSRLTKNGRTLICACSGGHSYIVREIINAGVDVNHGNDLPIIVASEEGHWEVVEALIKAGAELNLIKNNKTPLTAAASRGHLKVVKELIQAGSVVNLSNGNETPLTYSCKRGYLDLAVELINAGANINLSDKTATPLITAYQYGYFDIADELIKLGADINLAKRNNTRLISACRWGRLDIIEELIKAHIDVNLSDGNNLPLTIACEQGHICIVRELIRAGADVNNCGINSTPLTAACCKGNLNVVRELINARVDVNLKDRNNTPLITACSRGHLHIMEELIKAGANVDLNVATVIHVTSNTNGNLDKVGTIRHSTPLTFACSLGQLNVVKVLIKAHADVNLSNGHDTPLTAACREGHLHVVEELIKAKANINQRIQNTTPLTAACHGRHLNVIRQLIGAGADVNQSNGNKTPLTYACSKGNMVLVEELMKQGANINRTDEDASTTHTVMNCNQMKGCNTPLTAACSNGHLDIVQKLIQNNVDVNKTDGYNTSLTAACFLGQLVLVQKLIQAGANINQEAKEDTPLIIACYYGQLNIVKEFIHASVDVNLRFGEWTPLTTACYHGHVDIVIALVRAGALVNLMDAERTPLTAAIYPGHLDVVRTLITAGADIKLKDRVNTPMSIAIKMEHDRIVEELIKAKDGRKEISSITHYRLLSCGPFQCCIRSTEEN